MQCRQGIKKQKILAKMPQPSRIINRSAMMITATMIISEGKTP
jgi:hypothetical protein